MAAGHRARWQEMSPLLDELLALESDARTARLSELRRSDAGLAEALNGLLAQASMVEKLGFLDDAAVDCPAETLAGHVIGAYTLERAIGYGGMGTVWLARRSDGRFEAVAAVKLLNLALIGRGGAERFEREGRILARLDHPNIAHLLDAGVTATGQPYLVLEYVQGQPIDVYCDAHSLSTQARIALFMAVLDAVAHAHRNLVLHRDLKPPNILITAEGRVKLLDFGIAKLLEEGDFAGTPTELTQLAGRAFTPDYAAPEQVQGQAVTTATDVYALGVLLYKLLAGAHPTLRDSDAGIERIRAVVERDPVRLSAMAEHTAAQTANTHGVTHDRLVHELRGDLDLIAAKALKKIPAERYATVDSLAEDIRRYLRHEPVHARPDSVVYRASKFVRRNRVPVAFGTITILALVGGIIGTYVQAQRATHEAVIAREQSRRADEAARVASAERDFALRQLYRTEAIRDLNTFLMADASPSGATLTVSDLMARAEEIVTHNHTADDDTQIELLVSVGLQYKLLDRDEKGRELLERAYAESQSVADRSVRADAACALAYAVGAGGQNPRAEALVREGLAELPDDPRYVLSRFGCLVRGTETAILSGDVQSALSRALQANDIVAHLPIRSAVFEMRALINLGEAYRARGLDADAIRSFESAHTRLVDLGRERTETSSTLYNNWALALQSAGRTLEAQQLFERAIKNSSADGTGRDVSPTLLTNYARVLDILGRQDEARLRIEQALRAARQAGDEVAVNQALLVQTAVARQRGDLAGAARALDEVEPRLRRMLPAGHVGFSALASQRALLAEARNEHARALGYGDEAVEIVRTAASDSQFLPIALRRRAMLRLHGNDLAGARADAQETLELERRRVGPGRSAAMGLALLTNAKIARASGDSAAARQSALEALDHLRPTLGASHPSVREAEDLLGRSGGLATSASP